MTEVAQRAIVDYDLRVLSATAAANLHEQMMAIMKDDFVNIFASALIDAGHNVSNVAFQLRYRGGSPPE